MKNFNLKNVVFVKIVFGSGKESHVKVQRLGQTNEQIITAITTFFTKINVEISSMKIIE